MIVLADSDESTRIELIPIDFPLYRFRFVSEGRPIRIVPPFEGTLDLWREALDGFEARTFCGAFELFLQPDGDWLVVRLERETEPMFRARFPMRTLEDALDHSTDA